MRRIFEIARSRNRFDRTESKLGYSGKREYQAVNRGGGSEITNKTHEIVTLLPPQQQRLSLLMGMGSDKESTATWKTTGILLADVVLPS